MKSFLKKIIQNTLKFFNLKLTYYSTNKERYLRAIENQKINLILDIGANTGQFASSVIQDGYKGRIVSFEPTSDAYKKLVSKAKRFQNWKIHEQVAIGDELGTVTINIAGNNAASSSILKMNKIHEESAPQSKFIASEVVELITIDSVYNEYFEDGDKCLLKIDVQGFEDQVLKGAINCLKSVSVVKVECSLVSLYENDKIFDYYFDFFKQNGFKLYDIEPGFSNPLTGQLFQFDAVFVRI